MEKIKWTDSALAISTIILAIATIVLALYTYDLFKDAEEASSNNNKIAEAAKRSADLSEKAYYKALQKDSLDRIENQKKAFRDSQNLAIQINLANAQIQQLKESQKRFEEENQPYLQIGDFDDVTFNEGEPVKFLFKIHNVGIHPIQCLMAADHLVFLSKKDSADFIKAPFKQLPKLVSINRYITKETPMETGFWASRPLKTGAIQSVNDGSTLCYYMGRYEYINFINNRKRVYEFVLRLLFKNGKTSYKFEYCENKDVM